MRTALIPASFINRISSAHRSRGHASGYHAQPKYFMEVSSLLSGELELCIADQNPAVDESSAGMTGVPYDERVVFLFQDAGGNFELPP